jgi:hypothetical protein
VFAKALEFLVPGFGYFLVKQNQKNYYPKEDYLRRSLYGGGFKPDQNYTAAPLFFGILYSLKQASRIWKTKNPRETRGF